MQLVSLPHPSLAIESIFTTKSAPKTPFERVRQEERQWRALVEYVDEQSARCEKRERQQAQLIEALSLAQSYLETLSPWIRRAPSAWLNEAIEAPNALTQAKLKLVRHVSLSFEQLGSARFERLISQAGFEELHTLRVDDDVLSVQALVALAQSGLSARLHELHLNRVELNDACVDALTTARWPRLRVLSLTGNAIYGQAIMTLCERDQTPRLEELYLDDNALDDRALLAIAYSRALYSLRRLSLYNNVELSDVSAQGLLRRIDGYFPELELVELTGSAVSPMLKAQLAQACRQRWS